MAVYKDDFDKIEQLRKTASAANKEGAILTGGATTLGDRLRTDLNKHRAEVGVSKLAEGIGQVSGQVVSGGTDIESRNANVDPLEVDKMRARDMAQSLGALATLSEYDSSKNKTIEGVIGAGTNRLVAEAEKKKAEAQAANDEADNMLEYVKFKEELEMNKIERAYKMAQISNANKKDKSYTVDVPGVGPVEMSSSEVIDWAKTNQRGNVPATTKTKIANYVTLIQDMTQLRAGLGEGNVVSDLTSWGGTGPIAKLGGSYTKGAELRTGISDFSSDVMNQKYGGALTTGEIERAKEWAPAASLQETANRIRLDRQLEKKKNELINLMKENDFTDEEIQQRLEVLSLSDGEGEWVDTGATK
ncbi:MAG: hypothetical protein WC479_03045 [Candidatus Izemoplasmatales bacterium]